MGTTQGSGFAGPDFGEYIFAFYYRPVMLHPANTLPFILREAMVNHKKMVHPPCSCA